MRNIKLLITTIFTIIIMTVLSSIVYAGTISSISATEKDGKITVSGKADANVYAVAVVVYSGDTLEYMETTNVNSDKSYSVKLGKEFSSGTYEVRVADYNGGEYKTTSVEVNNNETSNKEDENKDKENTTSTEKKTSATNPTTGDIIMMFIAIFAVSTIGFFVTTKLNKRK